MESAKKCMIIGAAPVEDAGVFTEYDPKEYYVICADGGFDTALQYGIRPDLVVGDFDSVRHVPEQVKKVRLPVEKDVTDTMYAALVGVQRGCKSFVLLGCMGGARIDHTFANLTVLLELLERGCSAVMADATTQMLLLRDAKLDLHDMVGTTVSVFPYKESTCTLTYRGLKYQLDNYNLAINGSVMGVSNEIVEKEASIRVNAGTALIVFYHEK